MSATEERYGRAVRSSHLKMSDITPGDIDTLTAAGMADKLGTRLLRLRCEFDATRRRHLAANANYSLAIKRAHEARRKRVDDKGDTITAEQAAQIAETMREVADSQSLTAHLMILIELKSLVGAKQAIGQFAARTIERRCIDVDPDVRDCLVSEVINAWLDRKCHQCSGRGFTGGYEGPTVRCRTCRETGNRRVGIFSDRLALQALAEWMLVEMDRKAEKATKEMHMRLRNRA